MSRADKSFRHFDRSAFAGEDAKLRAAGGDASYAGKQYLKEMGVLHALVDPAGYDLIRKSWPRYDELPSGKFRLGVGIPMLVENLFDTTGSMAGNVKLMFNSLPKQYDLLAAGTNPLLGRYDTQIMNAIFGDVQDKFVLARTQAEMDVRIAEQLVLMIAEAGGGDSPEDPEYGLFGAAFLTDPFIIRYGLLPYHFMTTDATSHGRVDSRNLIRVFGTSVFGRCSDNGFPIDSHAFPMNTDEIVNALKKRAHAFAIMLGRESAGYWRRYYGDERVVVIDTTEHIAYVEAAIIGLTEGVLDLQSVVGFLTETGCSETVAREIQRAVAHIPIGAQTLFPNFDKIPGKGAVFANKHDLWPVAEEEGEPEATAGGTWL